MKNKVSAGMHRGLRALKVRSAVRKYRPRTKEELGDYLRVFLGLDVPDRSICPGHNSPLDYLWYSFNTDFACSGKANTDSIVWANRGGGKTELGAIATLLDCFFKNGCQVRILGGSGDQSAKMYDYLSRFIGMGFERFLSGPIRKERCGFLNGSGVEVLTQSPTSVRGQHIQKLRCDEVELFRDDVFSAAKFTTESKCGVLSGMEAISTMHLPYGLMQRIISSAGQSGTPVFKWCVWEVIERCVERSCSRCPLWPDCGGKALRAGGYLKIDDCITQMRRSSRAGWESEMLCTRPSMEHVVFSEFDPEVHVKQLDYDANLPVYRALDFGFVNPFVCLWIQVDKVGFVRVIDEYVRSRATIDVHASEIKSRTPGGEGVVAATFCDPAGAGVSDITGTSIVRELRDLGVRVRFRRSGILEGVELIRRAISSGDGRSHFVVSSRCSRLIEALRCYHYSGNGGEMPLKDGVYDHPVDALRYFFVNYRCNVRSGERVY